MSFLPVPKVVLYPLTALIVIGGLLLIVWFIRFMIDERENNKAGVNKRNRYMLRYEYETADKLDRRYYSQIQMMVILQPIRKMSMVLCGYPNAKMLFDSARLAGMTGVRALKWEYDTCKIILMEERSYFGIKAWYDLECVKLKA